MWPAWWTLGGGQWPYVSVSIHRARIESDDYVQTGEIDIIEGVHDNAHNQVTWHTGPSRPFHYLTMRHSCIDCVSRSQIALSTRMCRSPALQLYAPCTRAMCADLTTHAFTVLRIEHFVRRECQWQCGLWRHRMEQGILWSNLRRARRRGVRHEVGRSRHCRLCVRPSRSAITTVHPRVR